MNLSIVSSPATPAPGHKPSLNLPAYKTEIDHKAIDLSIFATENRLVQPSRRAAVLAREVRNPLTSINLSLDMLRAAITDPDLKVYLDIISRSSVRIKRQISELLKCEEIETLSQTHY
jgi:signal transduction histidine kinase